MILEENNKKMKSISLIVLTLQNAIFVIVCKYSKNVPDASYITSVMVFITEISKLLASIIFLSIENYSLVKSFNLINNHIINDPILTLKMSLPAFLYVIQNNLLFLAVSNLNVPTFQVCYQLKILTTAMFSYFILDKKLRFYQIVSLIILFIGISVVSVGNTSDLTNKMAHENPIIGIIAVILSSLTSGFAGVYSEKYIKKMNISVWIMNIQMASTGFILAFIASLIRDHSVIKEHGFMFNFGFIAWIVVFLQAFGGILVSIVMKYADNILKGYATSCAIILSTIFSILIFKVELTQNFLIGSTLVITSTLLYSYKPPLIK